MRPKCLWSKKKILNTKSRFLEANINFDGLKIIVYKLEIYIFYIIGLIRDKNLNSYFFFVLVVEWKW